MRIACLFPLLLHAAVAAAADGAPALNLTLTPHFPQNGTASLDGVLVIESPDVGSNETLVTLPLTITSNIPTARYDGDALQADDDDGPLPLVIIDDEPSNIQMRYWNTTRATSGNVTVRFTAYPRQVETDDPFGPLFDIRQNDNGLVGSAWALVPTPSSDQSTNYTISWAWDLSHSPSWTRGVWTWGESSSSSSSPIVSVNTLDHLQYTFWAVGNITSYPAADSASSSDFGMYWLVPPPFNTTAVATFVQNFFAFSTSFWHDTSNDPYRIFVRWNANLMGGGTALYRSFTFGYNNASTTGEHDLELLLAHEMTHNWPTMEGSNANITNFVEGSAEFYSLRLMWRGGFMDDSAYLAEMNSRVAYYYNDPYVNASDAAVQDDPWGDLRLQKIPYGRGLIWLANLDAELRERWNGTVSLDVLELALLERVRGGLSYTLEDFFGLLRQYLGDYAVAEYEQIATGSPLLKLRDGSLGPCFDVVQTASNPTVWQWQWKTGANATNSTTCVI
ncbi:hypothetical protein DBV05_g10659 [Lasiodiplodia theobromae]|uniref:Peptidase M61 catalytic domain-containing protein n=1 Tax=Lasiodiplodia theobromae TaxID=45133 RepID=A0A5N5CZH9_9PEZI|nr:hypothetical protein DBV05_g10659 [Lasiodiplodia theobromae]